MSGEDERNRREKVGGSTIINIRFWAGVNRGLGPIRLAWSRESSVGPWGLCKIRHVYS